MWCGRSDFHVATIGNSQLVEIVNSGHMSFVDQPEQFIPAVADFPR
jgi:pimeloyl-ACP methyl ester carboxylesterase